MVTVTSFTPPSGPGEVWSTSQRQPRRVAARAGADLQDDVLLVVRVLRDEEALQLLLGRAHPRPQRGELLLRELAQLRVLLGEEGLVVGDVGEALAVGAERGDGRLDAGPLLRHLAVALARGDDSRVGELMRQLLEPRLDRVELLQHLGREHGMAFLTALSPPRQGRRMVRGVSAG